MHDYALPRMHHRSPDGTVWRRSIGGWVTVINETPYTARRHGHGWAVLDARGGVVLSFAFTLRAAARRLRRRHEEVTP